MKEHDLSTDRLKELLAEHHEPSIRIERACELEAMAEEMAERIIAQDARIRELEGAPRILELLDRVKALETDLINTVQEQNGLFDRIRDLEEALRPFSDAAEIASKLSPREVYACANRTKVSIGDCMRAAELLKEQK